MAEAKKKPAVVYPPVRHTAPPPATLAANAPVRPAAPRPLRSIVLEDSRLAVMAGQPKFTEAFPFLRDYAGALRSCMSCGGRREAGRQAAKVKAKIANLDDGQKRKLKELLNAEQVTVYVLEADRSRRPVTF